MDDDNDRRPPPKRVVVCGGGVIGACAAYFLSKRGAAAAAVTLVEKSSVACAASGKAGGFLALDWCDGGPLSSLARASFNLHRSLSDDLDGPQSYGYRPLTTLSLTVTESNPSGSNPSGSSNFSISSNSRLLVLSFTNFYVIFVGGECKIKFNNFYIIFGLLAVNVR